MRTNQTSSSSTITTLYNQYENDVKEYIFSVKKRPFGMVTSPSLPPPTTSYIDFNLVDKLGLPMTDVQYRKLTYCGKKMRIVGKCAITVQCVRDGAASDNVHVRADVVLDLSSQLDVDSIPGVKMLSRLQSPALPATCSESPALPVTCSESPALPATCSESPSSPVTCSESSSPPGRVPETVSAATRARMVAMTTPTPPPTHAELIAMSQARRSTAWSRDNSDVVPDLHHHVRAIADTASLSPHAANLSMLDAMFAKADVKKDPEEQIHILLDVDAEGDLDEDDDGVNFTFIKYDGSRYKQGHGRYLCSSDCSLKRKPPHNCGYNQDYLFPVDFSPCSSKCKGAFCKCIRGGKFDI